MKEPDQPPDPWRPWPVWLAALVGLILTARAFWPGIMIDDARWQYQQAVDNAFEDWHPPVMAWVWRQLSLLVAPGPAPMLALQLLLAWGGLALIGGWAWRGGLRGPALMMVAAGFLPASLMLLGAVTKDCLMAGLLLCATGLLLWIPELTVPRRALARAATLFLLLLAAALRFNAFLACLPLALAALPAGWLASWPRRTASALLLTAAFLGIGPAISNALQAEKTGVRQSLIIFDLGGITAFSGQSVFPDLGVADPVQVNARCYDPYQWDTYSDWAKVSCPIGYDAIQPLVDDEDLDPTALWLSAIRHHPLAYAEHRLAHFNQATYFLIRKPPVQSGWLQSADNPWGYRVAPNIAEDAVAAADRLVIQTPLGFPIVWLAFGLAALFAALALRLRGPALALAASATLYGSGYLLVGVATGMRYQLWTWFAAVIAAGLVWAETKRSQRGIPRWLTLALPLLVVVPAVLALGARAGG